MPRVWWNNSAGRFLIISKVVNESYNNSPRKYAVQRMMKQKKKTSNYFSPYWPDTSNPSFDSFSSSSFVHGLLCIISKCFFTVHPVKSVACTREATYDLYLSCSSAPNDRNREENFWQRGASKNLSATIQAPKLFATVFMQEEKKWHSGQKKKMKTNYKIKKKKEKKKNKNWKNCELDCVQGKLLMLLSSTTICM